MANLKSFWPMGKPIWQYGANGQMTMAVHNYRLRQFQITSNGENPSSSYRDMGSASLAAARPTVTTIPLQPGGLRDKNYPNLTLRSKYHIFATPTPFLIINDKVLFAVHVYLRCFIIQCNLDISRLVGSNSKQWYCDISGSAIYRASVMRQTPFSSAL